MQPYNTEPEPDANLSVFDADENGEIPAFLNEQKADEFDPRYANDVEGLIYLGRLTADSLVYGHRFTLKTLTRGEKLAIGLFVRDYDGAISEADAMQTALLSCAIIAVDGRPLSISLGPTDNTPENTLARNFPILAGWYDALLEEIYSDYQHLIIRQAQAFGELEGKSSAGRATL